MRRNILNVLCVIGAPLFESTLAPRRSIAFRNSAGTWSRAPGKQFGVLDRWRDRHTRPARWSDTLRIRPVRWRKWNRIRIDLARLADPIGSICVCEGKQRTITPKTLDTVGQLQITLGNLSFSEVEKFGQVFVCETSAVHMKSTWLWVVNSTEPTRISE